jgi:hypothetical protein
MTVIRNLPRFDHGAALRVPPAHDAKGRNALWRWLGDEAFPFDEQGAVQVRTVQGPAIAWPGDWVILSVSGEFHVARSASGRPG